MPFLLERLRKLGMRAILSRLPQKAPSVFDLEGGNFAIIEILAELHKHHILAYMHSLA